MQWWMVAMSPKVTVWMALLILGCMQRSISTVCGETEGNSCLASWVVTERQKDGGLSSLVIMVCGRLAVVASANNGRCSSTVMSLGSLSSSLEVEDW